MWLFILIKVALRIGNNSNEKKNRNRCLGTEYVANTWTYQLHFVTNGTLRTVTIKELLSKSEVKSERPKKGRQKVHTKINTPEQFNGSVFGVHTVTEPRNLWNVQTTHSAQVT